MDKLEQARQEINGIDREMAALFERRMRAAEDVIAYKTEHGLPVLDSGRERAVLEQNAANIHNPAYLEYYTDFLQGVMELSKRYQRVLDSADAVAYQGVEGAYSHITLKRLFPGARAVSFETFEEVIRAVESGEIPCGVLPFENSYTGEVGTILDLLYRYDVKISRIYDLKISHNLLGLKGARLSDIRQVYSHEQGLSQCKRFLDSCRVEQISYLNTALAAKFVSESGDRSKAAIASIETAALYGLEVLAPDISTSAENTTRFIVISREMGGEGNRFSLLFTLDHDAGRLAGVMQIIARYGFNMDNIKSKSLHNLPWQYYFYVEIEGNLFSPEAQAMIGEMKCECKELKVLGSYRKE